MKNIISKRLKGLMAEHKITVRELSKRLSISEKSLSLKINGRCDWLYEEMIFVIKQFGFSEVKEVFPELYNFVLEVG